MKIKSRDHSKEKGPDSNSIERVTPVKYANPERVVSTAEESNHRRDPYYSAALGPNLYN